MDRRELLRWQLGLAWSLAELRLAGLTDAECGWEPAAPGAWTVRPGADGRWRADWVEPEPDPPDHQRRLAEPAPGLVVVDAARARRR